MTSVRIQILAVPLVFDSAFHIVRDSLSTAVRVQRERGPAHRVRVETVTVDGKPITTGSGQRVKPVRSASRTRPDFVVMPGFRAGDDAEAVVDYVERRSTQPILRWIASQRARGASLATGCTGVWLFAEAGVLEGRAATTTWYLAQAFQQRYPTVRLDTKNMTTNASGIRCAGAAMAHMDLVLGVIADVFGEDVCRRVAAELLLDARPSQTHFMISDFLTDGSEDVRRVTSWIKSHLREPISVSSMANAGHVSKRTLARRFKESTGLSPLQFVQRVRVEEAARLLRTTSLSVSEVAKRVGYGDRATLRRLMKRLTNQTPSDLRVSRSEKTA